MKIKKSYNLYIKKMMKICKDYGLPRPVFDIPFFDLLIDLKRKGQAISLRYGIIFPKTENRKKGYQKKRRKLDF